MQPSCSVDTAQDSDSKPSAPTHIHTSNNSAWIITTTTPTQKQEETVTLSYFLIFENGTQCRPRLRAHQYGQLTRQLRRPCHSRVKQASIRGIWVVCLSPASAVIRLTLVYVQLHGQVGLIAGGSPANGLQLSCKLAADASWCRGAMSRSNCA